MKQATSRLVRLVILAGVLVCTPAAAQTPDPSSTERPDRPGPWIVDIRGVTSGLPTDTAFFPVTPVETLVPARGFGLDAGGHVYVLTLGGARLGVGANYIRVRGTSEGVTAEFSTIAPQVSANFGTRDGWSYLSAGLGRASFRTSAARPAGTATRESSGLTAVNLGGGARWFLVRHLAVGFDVRFHRLRSGGATGTTGIPNTTLTSVSVGFSLR